MSPSNYLALTFCPLMMLELARQKVRRQSRRKPRGLAMASGCWRTELGQPVWGMSSGRQAQGEQAGMGRALAFKAAWGPCQLTPTGTRQDFLLPISSLQAEGKVLATDPCMDGLGPAWGFLDQDPPGIIASKSNISHKPGVYQKL